MAPASGPFQTSSASSSIRWSPTPEFSSVGLSIPGIPFVERVCSPPGAAETPRRSEMSVTTATLTGAAEATRPTSLRRTTAAVGAAAAAAVTTAAAAAHAAGISFEIDGETIPVLGFAQMTLLGAVLGGLLLAGLNRRSPNARSRFVQATVALTALSCIPSVAMPDAAGSQITLVALHVLAAAIIVPVLARHARS
jgi:hypothetical protein